MVECPLTFAEGHALMVACPLTFAEGHATMVGCPLTFAEGHVPPKACPPRNPGGHATILESACKFLQALMRRERDLKLVKMCADYQLDS